MEAGQETGKATPSLEFFMKSEFYIHVGSLSAEGAETKNP